MRTLPAIIGWIGLALGIVWILQGLNYLGGSFMTGQMQWFYIGAALALCSLALLAWTRRR